ncbi:MAG: putative metal-binding motif-containing protein, partial [Myxococcales bacterium]|nr:putative metal-binding motif-containing protein [Myxococcales bacterium]
MSIHIKPHLASGNIVAGRRPLRLPCVGRQEQEVPLSLRFARVAIVTSLLAACAGEPPIVPTDNGTATDGDADDDGYSLADGDCDDGDPNIHPDANDVFGDGIDQNCDDADGVDADGDGHAWTGSGGDDCDDAENTVYGGAPEIGWDDIDQDC